MISPCSGCGRLTDYCRTGMHNCAFCRPCVAEAVKVGWRCPRCLSARASGEAGERCDCGYMFAEARPEEPPQKGKSLGDDVWAKQVRESENMGTEED